MLAAAAVAACVTWLAGLLFTLVYAYAWQYPGSPLARGQSSPLDHLHRTLPIPADVLLTLGGLVLLAAAPRLTAAVAALDAQAARALLGPSRAQELEYRVEHLTQTGPAPWTPPTPNGADWNGTCTTAPSSGWFPWP